MNDKNGPSKITLARLGQKLDDNLLFMKENQVRIEKEIIRTYTEMKKDIKEMNNSWSNQRSRIYEKIEKNKDSINGIKLVSSSLGTIGGLIGGFFGGLFRGKL